MVESERMRRLKRKVREDEEDSDEGEGGNYGGLVDQDGEEEEEEEQLLSDEEVGSLFVRSEFSQFLPLRLFFFCYTARSDLRFFLSSSLLSSLGKPRVFSLVVPHSEAPQLSCDLFADPKKTLRLLLVGQEAS